MKNRKSLIALLCLLPLAVAAGGNGPAGLKKQAAEELEAAGVTKYTGLFDPALHIPVATDPNWTQHIFNPNGPIPGTAGPACIVGSPYSVFTRQGDPDKLLILLQGGGACWEDFYNCNPIAELQAPPPPPVGVWGPTSPDGSIDNPLADYSIVYLPYCDGSVFTGDNDVFDPAYPPAVAAQLRQPVENFVPFRFHRGLQNLTAGIDVAKDLFPDASKILVTGSSAGGVGAASFAPFLARFAFGNDADLIVLNDAGPNAINPNEVDSIAKRASDWQFGQFFPASCKDCDVTGQGTAIVDWRLKNDKTVREGFYSTDGDCTNGFFLNIFDQQRYRELIVSTHGELHQAYPNRYKRFIRSGDRSHTALQTPLFYSGTANGTPLYQWVDDLLNPPRTGKGFGSRKGGAKTNWRDIVEDFRDAGFSCPPR